MAFSSWGHEPWRWASPINISSYLHRLKRQAYFRPGAGVPTSTKQINQ